MSQAHDSRRGVGLSAGIGSRRYLDVAGTAEYLNMTEGAVYAAAERRLLPFRKLGRKLLFDMMKLDAYIEGLEGVDVAEAVARRSNGGTVNPLPE